MSRVQLSTWSIVALVALRVGIGLHFFYEGAGKLKSSKPFSAGFLGNAKGPFADFYKKSVWDADGFYRLNEKQTVDYWRNYAQQISRHYKFDETQAKMADQVVTNYAGRLHNYLGGYSEEIEEYVNQVNRRNHNAADPARAALPSLQAHDSKITGDRMKLWGKVMPGIDGMWEDLESDLNSLATQDQWKVHGRLPIGKIGRRFMDSEGVDEIIPWFDLIIGICLVLGLFVRPAAILAGLFLLTVCISQWPGAIGAAPIYSQAIEMLALFALAAVGAGNLAGLDFFLTTWRTRNTGAPATAAAAK